MNISRNKDGCCDTCYENGPTVLIEPHRCSEYGGCDNSIEICLKCFTKLITEE